ncbi:unnamed protein product [Fraxinus pennsylvanica]|uniref:Uncharacterized protein n=1 Tax=Fraxinus pennsylvanica TaxID=56036 RepID=A0AAD1YSM8_9LAMI|nr:unnamed protein product [Fraxinus pennsylvanica]
MRKTCLLRLDPRLYMPSDIVTLKIKFLNNLFNPIITIIIVNEPPLHSKPSMVQNPLAKSRRLVPYQRTHTKLLFALTLLLLLLLRLETINLGHRRHKYMLLNSRTTIGYDSNSHSYSSWLIRISLYTPR